MQKLLTAGRASYALGMAGLGLQQFFYPGFRPVFIPHWSDVLPDPQFLTYLFSIALIVACAFIMFNFSAKRASLLMAGALLLLFLLFHLPFHLTNSLNSLGAWTDAFKILALSGGAFVVADSFGDFEMERPSVLLAFLGKLMPLGRIFFSVMLIVFGIDHFLYAQFVATLVPEWIPGHLFWTYFAAVALIGSGISIISKIKIGLVSMLAGIMIFIWLLVLHIPRAIAMPELQNGNEVTSVFEALAFSGVAFVLACGYGVGDKRKIYFGV